MTTPDQAKAALDSWPKMDWPDIKIVSWLMDNSKTIRLLLKERAEQVPHDNHHGAMEEYGYRKKYVLGDLLDKETPENHHPLEAETRMVNVPYEDGTPSGDWVIEEPQDRLARIKTFLRMRYGRELSDVHEDMEFLVGEVEGMREIAPNHDLIVQKMANLLAMQLRMWDAAHREAKRCGSMEMVKEFNASCAEGERVHKQITAYFDVKTIAEARELLKVLGGKEEIELETLKQHQGEQS